MALVVISDFDRTVWDSDGEISSIPEFIELREKHGDEKSDLIVKAAYILHDPNWTKRRYVSEDERIKISNEWLKKSKATKKAVESFFAFYEEHVLSDIERELVNFEKLVRDRSEYFHGLNYKTDSAEKDKLAKTHGEFVTKLKDLRTLVDESRSGTNLYGNYKKSLLEGG